MSYERGMLLNKHGNKRKNNNVINNKIFVTKVSQFSFSQAWEYDATLTTTSCLTYLLLQYFVPLIHWSTEKKLIITHLFLRSRECQISNKWHLTIKITYTSKTNTLHHWLPLNFIFLSENVKYARNYIRWHWPFILDISNFF